MVLIFPVAADLDREYYPKERIVVGRETKIACDYALELAQSTDLAGNCRIHITAGYAGKGWANVRMADVMLNYMLSRPMSFPTLIATSLAEEFTTWGEMEELTNWIKTSEHRRDHFSQLNLVVKWWHAPRAKFLCEYWLKRREILNLPVTVTKCPSFAKCPTIAKEFLLAWPKNQHQCLLKPRYGKSRSS